jgi:hypothetical protein
MLRCAYNKRGDPPIISAHKNSGTVPEFFQRTVWSQTSMDTGFDARIKGWS